jgi:AcrR family transcriptional regulator
MLTVSTINAKILFVKKYHHGNLRAALIEGGLEVIAEKGVRALTLREIGARSGVSRTAAYRHFSNKADLLFAISEVGFIQFNAALQEARDKAGSAFTDRMHAMGEAYVRFARQHAAYYEVMFQNCGDHVRRGEAAARGFGILEQTIREGQDSNEVMPGDSNAIAALIWCVVHGIASLGVGGDGFIRFCVESSLRGIHPQSEELLRDDAVDLQ